MNGYGRRKKETFLQAIRRTFKRKFNTLNQCFLDVLYKKMKLNIKKVIRIVILLIIFKKIH